MFGRIFLSKLFWNQKIVSWSKIQKTKNWCFGNRSRPMKWARETLFSQLDLFICSLSACYVAFNNITTVNLLCVSEKFSPFLTNYNLEDCNACSVNTGNDTMKRACVWFQAADDDICERVVSFSDSSKCADANLTEFCPANSLCILFLVERSSSCDSSCVIEA